MTNKQKVREIMCCICQHWNNRNKLCYEEGCIYYIKALEIAEWKDKQFEEYKNKVISAATDLITDDTVNDTPNDMKKVGEVFICNGMPLKTVENTEDSCIGCFFANKIAFNYQYNGCKNCTSKSRSDKTDVRFEFIELQVGEELVYDGIPLEVTENQNAECTGCFFFDSIDCRCSISDDEKLAFGICQGQFRKDRNSVIFQ